MPQNALDFFTAIAWSVVLGVIALFVVAMFIEWARKPRLYLHIAPPSDQKYGDGGTGDAVSADSGSERRIAEAIALDAP
jgi:hypothetical protein